jgi:REP element-mobilizing transposase RayT
MNNNLPIRKLNRLTEYDYSNGGYYFVTICTLGKEHYFGKVEKEIMIKNDFGNIIEKQWTWLHQNYQYVVLDYYVVMPNHFHGIIIIDPSLITSDIKIKSLSELIGAFKTTSSKIIHRTGLEVFHWQKSFYDRIIRNEIELLKIRQYIQNNPLKWEIEKNNPSNLLM